MYVIDLLQKMSYFGLSLHKNGEKAELRTHKRNNVCFTIAVGEPALV